MRNSTEINSVLQSHLTILEAKLNEVLALLQEQNALNAENSFYKDWWEEEVKENWDSDEVV